MKPDKERKLRGGGKSELTVLKSKCLQEFEKEGSSPTLEQIMAWAAEPQITNVIVRQRIGEFFQVQLERDSQLSSFYSWVKLTRKTDEREAKIQHWLECEKLEHPELSDEELFQRGQRKFKILSIAEEDPEAWATVLHADREKAKEAANAKKLAIEERKLKLLEQKAAAFDAAKGVMGDKELTENQKRQRMLELFGM